MGLRTIRIGFHIRLVLDAHAHMKKRLYLSFTDHETTHTSSRLLGAGVHDASRGKLAGGVCEGNGNNGNYISEHGSVRNNITTRT